MKIGFHMKKVSDMLILMAETHIPNSSLIPLSNIVLKSGQTSLLTLVPNTLIFLIHSGLVPYMESITINGK